MAKNFKRVGAWIMTLAMCVSFFGTTTVAAESLDSTYPVVTVQLTPGADTNASAEIEVASGTLTREITATTSEIDIETKQTVGALSAIQPALKFDRNSTTDQKAQKVARELYTDNGHFHDPSTFTVTGAPEGYPFKYVGHGDYSGHYVSHVRVVFKRDEAGKALKDAAGNYIIDHLEHASSGTPLYYGTELTTNIDGPYHYATGTRAQQFLLMDEAGNTYYGYCVDLATGAEGETWYALANLEDNDYYASEEAERHVRGIISNGYWGTESGTGSLASLKEALKAAVAAGSVEDDYNIKMVNRKKFTTGYELAEGEYHYGSYVYWDIPAVDVTLTDEIIDQMTEGEALDAMQAAIWSWANGSQATLNGVDGVVVGDMSVASSQMSDSLNGKNDPEGAARTRALYAWLMQQKASASSVIINDKTFADNISLSIGKQLTADAYEASLKFTMAATPDQEKDNLTVVLTYVDADGVQQTIRIALTGENAVAPVDGFYTIDGLRLNKANPFQFTLNIVGEQYLTKNAYIFTSEKGTNGSQTMVSMAEGTISVDISKSIESSFDVKSTFTPVIPPKPPVDDYFPDIPVDKEADGLDEKDQTNVTLTVGGESEAAPVDIVIALGAGIAKLDNTSKSMISLIEPLVEAGVPVKLGLVAVEHYKDVAMGLTELTVENYKTVIDKGLADIQGLPAGPTNLHSNIEAAKAMLDADGAVMAENKYFYVIATGRTYNYDNEYGAPTTIINTVDLKGQHYYYWGHYLWQSQRGQHTSLYRVPTSYNNNFAAYWADVEKWVAADGDTYAYTFPIASYDDPQWFNDYLAKNSSDAKALGLASSRFGWIIHDLTGKTVAAIGSGTNPQNALNYERAQYEAYYAYNAMVEAGYKCQALCSESVSYQNYSPYMSVQGVTPGIQLGHSFMDHMAKLSGQEAATVLFQLTDNNGNYKTAENFFTAIEPVAGAATVPAGSYVEDFIGKNANGNFEFKPEAKYLTLVNNGVTYKAAEVDAKEGADASFTFTAPEATEPTFTLDYYYGDGKTTEKFVWTFGKDVTGTITLTYKLQLIGKQEAEGNYTVNTNNSATLYPAGGDPKDFPIPTVDYEVKKEIITPPDPMDMGGQKTSEKVEENRFEIAINVPGKDGDNRHDEVILMVDGSYSMDNEWPAMKDAINTIGETVLNGNGNTQLTLMAFGMGDNIVLKHVKSADELASALGELPGNLLYGRSSTNCEAGFTGVEEYIRNHDNTLHEVQVIFISDGNLNTDETPRAFDTNWQAWATAFGALAPAQEAFCGTVDKGNLPAAFKTVFGSRFDGMTKDQIIAATFDGSISNEDMLRFGDLVWEEVYAYSNLVSGKEYPVSDVERAFVKYDKEKGTYIQNLFYYTTYNSKYVTYGNRWTRTPAAAEELAKLGNVAKMYVVDYDSYTAWMDTGITSDKSIFVQSNGIAGLCDALAGALTDLSKAPFSDVVVTDYMSKWVNLDASTLKIVDNTTGEAIWTAADGWLISENRPTAKEVPVVVELVDPADYEAGGEDVIGNTNGDIYKLTWYVKDGAMLRADTYALKYEVDVDTAEEGFVDNTNYPANGTTTLTYTDENGNKQTNEIKVPDVHGVKPVPEIPVIPTVSFKSGEVSNISFMLIDANGNIEFLRKIDAGSATSYEIPTEEGKISAVFMKQGNNQGLFWASQELSEDLWQKVIDCVDDNNPSYKGYTAIASGMGEHSYIFKGGKTITYTFAGDIANVAVKEEIKEEVIENTEATTPSEPAVPEVEAPKPETPKPEAPKPEAPKPEAPKPEAPKGELTVKVEGGKVKNWTVINGVTGIYIEANGKIPAVIWTSVKVEGATLDAFIEALGADAENEVLFGFGEHKVEYQHNKNKTKTVTFTFTNLAQEEPAPAAEVAEAEASEPVVVETQASEPVVEETKPEATETEPEVEETKASEPVVEETEPVVEETEPKAEETKGNGKNKNKKNK